MDESQNVEDTEGNQDISYTVITARLLQWFGLENPDGQHSWKHSHGEILIPVVGMAMFSFPAILILFAELSPPSSVQGFLSRSLLSISVFAGILVFLWLSPRTGEEETSQVNEWPQVPENANIDIVNRQDTWLTEYKEISEEALKTILAVDHISAVRGSTLVGNAVDTEPGRQRDRGRAPA